MSWQDWLANIEARANAATPGPWFVEALAGADGLRDGWWQDESRTHNVTAGPDITTITTDGDGMGACSAPDADFIASCRTDVPALVDEVRRLRARVVGWQPAESFHEGDQVRLPDGSTRVIGSAGAPGTWSPYRVTPHPETLQLDPPLTFEAGEMAVWATDGSRVGRYRQDDAGEWRLVEQREVSP